MSGNSHDARSIFIAALALNTPGERSCYLDEACKGNPELRSRVEKLLSAHELADDFLETDEYDGIMEGPGTIIDHYKLLEEIGEGGFGIVFMAEQIEPIRRKVALKIVKPGMDTKQVIARFEAERQALALMDHPNIAHIYDAGTTETGRPYFVMELVHGVPITEFCDINDLTPGERLELFLPVCEAVRHAHRQGVIHRDLKPSNILVTLHDGKSVPKVIDFGTAKALQQSLTEKTLFTAYGKLIGTPQYMSPEQAEMSGLDVDTRTDIYSLGVVLYELLTGTTPFEARELRAAAFEEMMNMIRRDAPPKPSTRVSLLGEKASEIAKHRQVDQHWLQRALRGDLDWIVMKAIEKERDRRYDDVVALSEDVDRYLNHEPVSAGPPSFTYRARKYIRRHRAAALIAVSFGISLLLGVGVSVIGYLQHMQTSSGVHVPETELDIWLDFADFNGDGKLFLAEFLSAGKWAAEKKATHFDSKTWIKYFNCMDVDDDSFVTSGEGTLSNSSEHLSTSANNLVGTWNLVERVSEPDPADPPISSMRLVMTPANEVFMILHLEDRTHEIRLSSYRIEGKLFYEDFIAEQAWQHRLENGLLVMENDHDKFVFEAMK